MNKYVDKLLTTLKRRLGLIAGIIAAVVIIKPYAVKFVRSMTTFVKTQTEIVQMQQDVHNLLQYHLVLSSIIRANTDKINCTEDHKEFYVNFNGTDIVANIRKSKTGDVFVFVADGKAGVYSVKYNFDEEKYSYIDFDGEHHFINKREK